MKKILFLVVIILAAFAGRAQVVTISNPYRFLQWISVKDSVRGAIFLQNGDTLATQAYARGFAGSGVGYGIKRVAGNITFDTAGVRKMDSAYAVNDSIIGFKINGIAYTFKIRGRYSPGTPCTDCLLASNNFSDIGNTTTARINLGLGTAATKDAPASGDATTTQVVLGSDSRLLGGAPPGNDMDIIFNHSGVNDANDNLLFDYTNYGFCVGCGVSIGNASISGGGGMHGSLSIFPENGSLNLSGDTLTLKSTAGTNHGVRIMTNNQERFKILTAGDILFPTLISTSDTTANKPGAYNPTTHVFTWLDHWPAGSAGGITGAGNLSPLFTTGVSGSSITFTQSTVSAHSYFGNNQGFSSAPVFLTNTQLTADLNLFSTSLQGLTPASGGGTTNFLRADGTWAPPAGTGATNLGQSQNATTYTITSSTGSPTTLLGVTPSLAGLADTAMKKLFDSLHNGSWAAAHPFNLRHGTEFGAGGINSDSLYVIPDTMTARLSLFTATTKGLVPLSGGGTTNFLRADGNWGAPAGGGSPGGSDNDVQYKNGSAFNGSSGRFTWNNSTKKVSIFGTSTNDISLLNDHSLKIIGNYAYLGDTTSNLPTFWEYGDPYNHTKVRMFNGWLGTREYNAGVNLNYRLMHQFDDTAYDILYMYLGENGWGAQGVGKGHSNFAPDHVTPHDVFTLYGKVPLHFDWLKSGNEYIGSTISTNELYLYDPTTTDQQMLNGSHVHFKVASAALKIDSISEIDMQSNLNLYDPGGSFVSANALFTAQATGRNTTLYFKNIDNNSNFIETNYVKTKAGSFALGSGVYFHRNNYNGGQAYDGVVSNGNFAAGGQNAEFFWTTTNPGGTTAERMRLTDSGHLKVNGLIESTTLGIKFPDGTIQTTASTGGAGSTNITVSRGPTADTVLSSSGTAGILLPADATHAGALDTARAKWIDSSRAGNGVPSWQKVLSFSPTFTTDNNQDLGTHQFSFYKGSDLAASFMYGNYSFNGGTPVITLQDTALLDIYNATWKVQSGDAHFGGTVDHYVFDKSLYTTDNSSADHNYGFNGGAIRLITTNPHSLGSPMFIGNHSSTGLGLEVAVGASLDDALSVLNNGHTIVGNTVTDNSSGAQLQVHGSVSIAEGNQAVGKIWTCTNATTGAGSWQTYDPNIYKSIVTTDATATILDTLATPDNTVVEMDVSVLGTDAGNTVVNYIRKVRILQVTGTYTLLNSSTVSTDYQDPSMTSTSITIATVSGLPILKVTGISGHNIAWKSVRSNRLVQVLTP